MSNTQLLIFRLDDQRYALPINVVDRVVRAAEVTPLPEGPEIVLGIINIGGCVLPVLDVRRRFGLPLKDINPSDQFIVSMTSHRAVVLAIDEAQEVIDNEAMESVDANGIVPGTERIKGVVKLENGMALIHDLEKFLSLDEVTSLDRAMQEVTRGD